MREKKIFSNHKINIEEEKEFSILYCGGKKKVVIIKRSRVLFFFN